MNLLEAMAERNQIDNLLPVSDLAFLVDILLLFPPLPLG